MTTTASRIFDDLLNLEINLIIKPGMTARKMPAAHQALLDVIGDYDQYLCEQARRLNPLWEELGSPRVPVRQAAEVGPHQRTERDGSLALALRADSVPSILSLETFDELRERAVEAEAVNREVLSGRPELDEGESIVLKRIYRNSDQIKEILRAPKVARAVGSGISREAPLSFSLPLTADEMLTVRKVWEVGIESIVLQTVAQVDGDIVTRVQRARVAATSSPIHSLHQNLIGCALEHWQFLFQTVAQFTSKALQSFLSR